MRACNIYNEAGGARRKRSSVLASDRLLPFFPALSVFFICTVDTLQIYYNTYSFTQFDTHSRFLNRVLVGSSSANNQTVALKMYLAFPAFSQ